MKTSLLLWTMLTLVSIGISSCIEPVYIPNKTNVPLFRREKQAYANLAIVDDAGISLGADYAITGPIFIGAGGNIQDRLTPFEESMKTNFFYGEAGYFTALDPMFSVELSTGYGVGSSETYDLLGDSSSRTFDHNAVGYNRFHLQASLGFHWNPSKSEQPDSWGDLLIEAAISGRASFLNTNRYEITHYDANRVSTGTNTKLFSETFIEPSFTLRIGVEHLMLEGQVGISKLPSSDGDHIPYKDSFLSIGLVSRF